MRAVLTQGTGGPDVMHIGETPDPELPQNALLVRVRAAALNRLDLLQRRGQYPPPPGAPDILGLEMAGEVEAVGADVRNWRPGDRVMALLSGGGYAEKVAVPAEMAMRLPENMSFEQGAAVPEAFLTAWQNLKWNGKLKTGERLLIHAGASGVGTAAIQLGREMGAEVFVTAGSAEKLAACRELGAADGWNYRETAFADRLLAATGGHGADVILDPVGASHYADNLRVLADDGRLVVIGLMGGAGVADFNLARLLRRRLTVTGSTLRNRPAAYKAALTRDFAEFALPRLADGRIAPVIDSVWSWKDVHEAHRRMEQNLNIGKIVLRID